MTGPPYLYGSTAHNVSSLGLCLSAVKHQVMLNLQKRTPELQRCEVNCTNIHWTLRLAATYCRYTFRSCHKNLKLFGALTQPFSKYPSINQITILYKVKKQTSTYYQGINTLNRKSYLCIPRKGIAQCAASVPIPKFMCL
jgi:hypothetical protein